MANIGLISCVSKKANVPMQAKNLYTSDLFRKSKAYVESECDRWFILSAKYGLVEPEQIIHPYNETLNSKSSKEKLSWALSVFDKLKNNVNANDEIVFIAGENYRKHLIPLLEQMGCTVTVPLKGLGIGKQLKWLKSYNAKVSDY